MFARAGQGKAASEFGFVGLGFRIQGLGFRAQGLGLIFGGDLGTQGS